MKINVTENKVSIKEEQILNENEYNIHKIQFDFSSEYTDDLVKIALFSIDNHTYKKIISNNECDIPPEVLTQRGYSILGVYAYKTEQDTLVLRYSPSPTKISVYDGSYKADAENSEPITPSEIEQYQQILQNSLQQFQSQYNTLVEETEGDIQAIEDELQRKVDEGYFDGEDGFSPIAKVIQKSNGATIEIEDKNGKTTADVLNGEDGYTPVRGVDYWTEEDKQEVEEEATQQIEGKIEEYNENAAEKLNQYNQNSVQKTNDYNTNAEQKMSAYNTNATEKLSTYNSNATEKFNNYNSNAEQKETNYNTNASQKVESFNTNANSKLSEYNTNAETKKTAYDENATQKTTSFNTNATNKLTEYNTNHTEKMSAYNSNSTQKLNAFNENATQKTEDFDEHTEEIQDNIEILQRTDNQILSSFNKDEEVSGQDIALTGTTEIKFAKPPLPMGNSEQVQYSGKNLLNISQLDETVQGIRFKGNDNNELTISGTYTGSANYISFPYKAINLPAGTYTFTSDSNNTPSGITLRLWTTPTNLNLLNGGSGTTQEDLTSFTFSLIGISNGGTYNITYKIQLENGNTKTDFEPYVGGTASPNPDYPQEITNVTGDVEVKVQNKNWINFSNEQFNVYKEYQNLNIPAGTYTFSSKITSSDTDVSICRVYFYGTDVSPVFINLDRNIRSSATVTLNGTYNRIILYASYDYIHSTGDTAVYEDCQLEQGTTSTNFVEHKSQTFTFPLGNEKLMLGDYLADDGIHHVRGQDTESGTTITLNDAKSGGTYLCNKKTAGNLVGKTLTFDTEVTDVLIEYELEQEVIIPYTSAQQEVYNQIKNAYSYDEMTIITGYSDGNKPFFIVQTYKDLNKELNNKVDKVQGKELSSNDFTDTLKEKLEGLENYDDTEIKADISDIQDEQTEQNTEIEKLQTENTKLKNQIQQDRATLPTTTETGQDITLDKTAEMEFVKPPLPRGNTKQDTTTGKNLLNTSNANTTTVNGVTSYRSNGFYYLSGTNTKTNATWVLPNTQNTNLPTFEIGQTYTMSFKGTIPNGIYAQLNAVKASTGAQYSIGSVRNTVPSLTFTIDSDYSSTAQLFVGIQGATTNADCNFAIQIEKGSTATSYEPYTNGASPNPSYPQEVEVVTGNVEVTISNENNTESKTLSVSLGNIELCKIGNYQDYLYKNNGKWYKYNAINKSVFNGSENWNYNVQNNVAYLQLTTKFSSRKGLFSNLFSYYNDDWTTAPDNTISEAVSSNFIFIKSTVASNISTWKSWLSTHNTIVYYVLATPTSTEITDATLISQLEEISKTLSYQGQTNITSNTIALFDVEAYQSTKLLLENIESRLTLVEG